jgi:hypothetical protein
MIGDPNAEARLPKDRSNRAGRNGPEGRGPEIDSCSEQYWVVACAQSKIDQGVFCPLFVQSNAQCGDKSAGVLGNRPINHPPAFDPHFAYSASFGSRPAKIVRPRMIKNGAHCSARLPITSHRHQFYF